ARIVPRGAERAVLRALARGIVVSAVIGLIGFAAWGVADIETPLIEFDRLCSTMPGDPNIYRSLLPVAIPLVPSDPQPPWYVRATSLGVRALALLASGSRSGLVGALLGLAVWGLVGTRDRWATSARSLYLALGVGTVVAGLVLCTSQGAWLATMLWEHTWRL